ncbi:hypothetical protein TB2_005527 [Malus domestica]
MPLYLTSEANVRRLAQEIGEFLEFEYPSKARGFLCARIIVNTWNPLTTGCWLPRENNKDTWVEFRYEGLQDFCYCCGRIVQDEVVLPRALNVSMGDRMVAGVVRHGSSSSSKWMVEPPKHDEIREKRGSSSEYVYMEKAPNGKKEKRKRQRQEDNNEKWGTNHPQWVMTDNTPILTHQIIMGYGPMQSMHPHIMSMQSRQLCHSSLMIHEVQDEATNQAIGVDTELSVGQLPGTDQDQNRGSTVLSYPQAGRHVKDKEKE